MSERHRRINRVLIGLILLLSAVLLACIAALALPAQEETGAATEESLVTETVAQPTEGATETGNTTEATGPEITEPTTDPVTEPSQPDIADQPSVLTTLLEQSGTAYEDLAQQGCSHLVTVVSQGTTAQIRFYSCADGRWETQPDLSCGGYVGRSGVYAKKQEGDGSTPSGLYSIGSAFYIDHLPDTALEVFHITEDTYWVDDPDSMFYNQHVEGTENKDWDSAEHMIDFDVYRYGFVVDYNTAAEHNAGSAIFFHVGDHPTAGCIATEADMVAAYLAALDRERNPHILIVCGDGA